MPDDDPEGITPSGPLHTPLNGPIRPRPENRRLALIRATLRVLERDGWSRLTARKVAAEAGLSLGHITYHFRSMDDLLLAACHQMSDDLQAFAEAQPAEMPDDPMGRFTAFVRAAFRPEFLTHGYLRIRIDLWSAAQVHPAIASADRALQVRYRGQLIALLEDIARPHGTVHLVRDIADATIATMDGLWLAIARHHDPGEVERGLRVCCDYTRLLLAPGAAAP